MPTLRTKSGEWELPHFHKWKDRGAQYRHASPRLIGPKTKIATIGSCFAAELARQMASLQLNAEMNPTGRVYTSASIRQEIERCFGLWNGHEEEPYWKVDDGFVHPFKNRDAFPTVESLRAWSDEQDERAARLFGSCDVVAITLGHVEAWLQPRTGSYYRNLPHPDAMTASGAQLQRLTVSQIVKDLTRIRHVLRERTHAEIIITVSPIPLSVTMTDLDVRIANAESKSRIRAAVSEFVEQFPDVHYFHSYEIVACADRPRDLMRDDGRHVRPETVAHILDQFLAAFGAHELQTRSTDSRLTPAPADKSASLIRRAKRFLRRRAA